MPTRHSRTHWTGTFDDGSGTVELSSSRLASFDVSFPKRSSEDGGGSSNPEELMAAAHSACFAMQLSAILGEAGGTPVSLDTASAVTLGADPNGGFMITGIALTVHGKVTGIDETTFQDCAEKAKAQCPVSKALAGVTNMTLEATFEDA